MLSISCYSLLNLDLMASAGVFSISREHNLHYMNQPKQELVMMNDRFSTLSEQLAYHILSFLNVEDLARLMLVSKRCKSLCVSVPCLTVDNRNYTHNQTSSERFNQLADKFLLLRSNSGINIQHFTLVWSFQGIPSCCDQNKKRSRSDQKKKRNYESEYSFIDTEKQLLGMKWVLEYSLCGAERLSVSMVPEEGNPIRLLYHIFCFCISVKDLTFCCNNFSLSFPRTSNNFSSLESLTIQSARIVDDTTFNAGIRRLRILKSLYLYDCTGLKCIRIGNPSLKQLKIISGKPVDLSVLTVIGANLLEKIFLTWYPADFSNTKFIIADCPVLQDFVWYGGYPMKFACIGNMSYLENVLSHLQSAALYLTLPPGSEDGFVSRSDIRYYRILPSFQTSAKLRLHAKTIEILLKLGHLTTQLDALRNLAIDYCFLTDDQVPIIASFLKTISCLEAFTLMSSANIIHGSCEDGNLFPAEVSGFNVEYWETQELRFINQLREATVEVHREEGNDMELVKYLMKHAGGLENLTIVCTPAFTSSISGRLNPFIKASTKLNFCLRKPQSDAC